MNNLDKVYLVSSGCYSDRYNVGVFSSEELAKRYIKIHFIDNDEITIESFILDPGKEEEVKKCYYMEYHFYNGSYHFQERYNIQYNHMEKENLFDKIKINKKWSLFRSERGYILSLTTLPRIKEDIFDIELRMMKTMQDKITEIKSLLEIEGWPWGMVEDYIEDYKEELSKIEDLVIKKEI